MANVTVAYILWLFGGIFGLHHLYLNRPRQCFIWFVSWGGMVMGWLTEVFQIKQYVEEANESKEFRTRMKEIQKQCPRPGFSLPLLMAQFMIGHQLANLLILAVPEFYTIETWYGPYLTHVLAALGASIGVHLVANIGPQEAPFSFPFLVSACTFPASFFLVNRRPVIILMCVIIAAYVSSEYAQWSRKQKPIGCLAHLKIWLALGLALVLYGALWTSNMYFNFHMNTLNGTRVPLRVAAVNFMKTQPWDESRDAMQDLIPCLRMYNYEMCQNHFLTTLAELSDPGRDAWAFSVLGFETYPSQKHINKHCRKLSSKWHPDRHAKSNDTEKKVAEKKFIDVQKACGMLNKLKQKRERVNTWTMSDTETRSHDVNTETDDVEENYTTNDDDYADIDDETYAEEEDNSNDDDNEGVIDNDDADNKDDQIKTEL